jgi:hypothetical protein
MSNDRIFIRCPVCKDAHIIFKYYPSGSFTYFHEWPHGFDFMAEHLHGCGERYDGDLNGDPFFVLETESPELLEHINKVQRPKEAEWIAAHPDIARADHE